RLQNEIALTAPPRIHANGVIDSRLRQRLLNVVLARKAVPPPGAVRRLLHVDHEAKRMIARGKLLRDFVARRLDKPADGILEVPTLRLVVRVGDVVYVVLDFRTQVQVAVVPGYVIP